MRPYKVTPFRRYNDVWVRAKVEEGLPVPQVEDIVNVRVGLRRRKVQVMFHTCVLEADGNIGFEWAGIIL